MKDLHALALQWFEAFNQHHLENLLALYHEDAEHYSPKLKVHQPDTKGFIKGKLALRSWWQDAFERLPDLHYEILNIMNDDQQICMEYIRQTPHEADMRIAEVLLVRDGKIVASRVYHD